MSSASGPDGALSYENRLLSILTLTYGVVFLDRTALNFLAPFLITDLHLSNTQLGMLATALSITWAISGIGFGRYCDRLGHHKRVLIVCIAAFSLCSVSSGLTTSFVTLLLARLLMGLFEGPVLPISQVLMAIASSPGRRGLNMGVMQQFGSNLFGLLIAPLAMVALAQWLGWRGALFSAALPGFACALILAWTVRPPAAPAAGEEREAYPLPRALRHRNIPLCMALSGLSIAWALLCFIFLPLYFTTVLMLSPTLMSLLMSAIGASAIVACIVVPALSDRYGRKPVVVAAAISGLCLPLGVMAAGHSVPLLILALVIGFASSGAVPLFMATIPTETLASTRIAGVLGLIIGTAEVFGGVVGPIVGGVIADAYGLTATLWLQAGLMTLVLALAFALKEPERMPINAAPA